MQQAVFIQVLLRDAENNIVGGECSSGYTEDDGVTCVVPLGYLPNIQNAAPSDIILTVQPPATITNPVSYVSSANDEEGGTRTVVLNLQPE